MAGKIASWKVAAALMILERDEWHYTSLTNRIIESKLTGLGKSGETPWQTLRVDMMEQHPDLFCHGSGRGWYRLCDMASARKKIDVGAALRSLIEQHLAEYTKVIRDLIFSPSIGRDRRLSRKKELEIFFLRASVDRPSLLPLAS